jgi:hypothetical protein
MLGLLRCADQRIDARSLERAQWEFVEASWKAAAVGYCLPDRLPARRRSSVIRPTGRQHSLCGAVRAVFSLGVWLQQEGVKTSIGPPGSPVFAKI